MLTQASRSDYPSNPIEKPGYVLEFSDEFNQQTIDTEKWIPCYLPQWSSCEQAAANYTFAQNTLLLQITEGQQPWCPEWDGENRASGIQSGMYAGEVGSKIGQSRFSDELVVREAQTNVQKYAPQFGYIETRVKATAASANHVSLWMIGYEDKPEKSGEICLFELLGNENGKETSKVRYGVHPWADPALKEEFFIEDFPLDSAQFHIYAVDWTPTHIDFFIDNVKVKTVNQSPQYPMQLMLAIFELPYEGAWNGDYDPTETYPKTFTVDYVRGYQPENGYRE